MTLQDNFPRNPDGRAGGLDYDYRFNPSPQKPYWGDPMDGDDPRVTLSLDNPCRTITEAERLQADPLYRAFLHDGIIIEAEWGQCPCEELPPPYGLRIYYGLTAIVAAWAVWAVW